MADLGRLSDGQREIQRLTDAGFTGPEIQQYRAEQTERLKAGGFQPQDIDEYWGAPPANANDGLRRIYDHQMATPDAPPGASEEALRAGLTTSYSTGGADSSPFVTAAASLLGGAGGTMINGRLEPSADAKHLAATLMDIYEQTGVPPRVLIEKAADPAVRAEILSHDNERRVSETLADATQPITAENIWNRTRQQFGDAYEDLQRTARDPIAQAVPGAVGVRAIMDLFGMALSPFQAAATEAVGKPVQQWATDHPQEAVLMEHGPLAPFFQGARAQQTIDSLARGEIPDLTAPLPMEATGGAIVNAATALPMPRLPRFLRGRAARVASEMPEVPPAPSSAPELRGSADDSPLWAEGGADSPGAAAIRASDEHAEMMAQNERDAAHAATMDRAATNGNLGLNQIMGLERTRAAAARLGVSESQVVSPAGAIGRYQIMPATGKAYGYTREQLFDPVINERVARTLLADLQRRFPGDAEAQAIAYNAGPVRAYKWIAAGRRDSVLPRETQGYVARLREWMDLPGRRPDDIARQQYRVADQRASRDTNWEPPPGNTPARLEEGGGGGSRGGEPPRGAEDLPPEGQRRIGHMSEEDLGTIIDKRFAPEAPRPARFSIRNILQDFRSELSHLEVSSAAEKSTDLHARDMFRQRYASAERVGIFVDKGPIDAKTLDIKAGPSWKDAYRFVKEDGGDLIGFSRFRNAARDIELSLRGITNPFADIEVAKAFLRVAHKKYKRGLQTLSRVKDGVVDYVIDSDRYSPEGGAAMKEANRYHISHRRAVDPSYVPPGARPRGRFGNTKKIQGDSERLIVDQDIADFDNMSHQIAMADHNRAVLHFVEAWRKGDIPEVNLTKDVEATRLLEDARAPRRLEGETVKDEAGEPIADPKVAEVLAAEFRLQRAEHKLASNKFVVYRKGRPEVWSFEGDPYIFRLLTYPGMTKDNPLMKVGTGIAKFMRSGVASTATFIERVFVRNELEDFVVGKNIRAPFEDFFRGVGDVVFGSKLYDSMQAKGAFGTALADIDRNYLKSMQSKIFEEPGKGIASRVWNVVNPYNWPEGARMIQRIQQNARQVGYIKRLTKQGVPDIKAAMESRVGYMDLAEPLSANWTNGWSRLTVFMRTSVKSIERMSDAFKERPVTFMTKGITAITLPTVANYVLNMIADESLPEAEKYANQPQWLKDFFWLLPPFKVGDTYVRIPIPRPYTVGFVFGTVPERMMDYFVKEDPRAFREFGKAFMQQFAFPVTPAIATPVLEDMSNTSFTGAPLVPRSLAEASGYMQYKPDTSETARALSRLLSSEVGVLSHLNVGITLSPIELDNYAKGWTGSLPMQILKALESPWHYDGRPWEAANIPLVGVFIARNPGAGAQPIQDFYNEYDHVVAAHRDLKLATEHQDMSEIRDAATLKAFISVSGVARTLREQGGIIQAINRNQKLTDPEKQKFLDAMYTSMIITAKSGLAAIDALDRSRAE